MYSSESQLGLFKNLKIPRTHVTAIFDSICALYAPAITEWWWEVRLHI